MNRILIVDDEAEIRESLDEILREEGYSVSSTASGPRRSCCCATPRTTFCFSTSGCLTATVLTCSAIFGSLETEDKPEVIVISGPRHHRDRRQSHQARRLRFSRKAVAA